MSIREQKFMLEAIALSRKNIEKGHGGPFGAVVVQGETIVGRGYNQVILTNDPTAHAEIMAIRQACLTLGTYELAGCEIYSSCEPCPMCLGAIYWSRLEKLYFGCNRYDARDIGFDDNVFYHEVMLPLNKRSMPSIQIMSAESREVFELWQKLAQKPQY
ncbi:nucleoside deaminase [Desulfonatronovibrio magnus]|uniref:nucleoside deaminase n=1 Tax=Desulfonatronovibrio magnus TaxID=698827 RepID=UPI000A91F71F|nr:nucleoside deaminase [Desulfonatronovibrio magnus]